MQINVIMSLMMTFFYTGLSAKVLFPDTFKNKYQERLIDELSNRNMFDLDATEVTYKLQEAVDCGGKFCKNGGTCNDDGKTCACPEGTSEDDCSGLDGCTTVFMTKCSKISSECIYDLNAETRATCKCKKLNEKFDGEKCSEACDQYFCKNGATCNEGDRTCMCADGTAGVDCGVVVGCTESMKKKCTEISSECIFDTFAETKATCKCEKENEKFDGKMCSVACGDYFCKNGASCYGNRICMCPAGVAGDDCGVAVGCTDDMKMKCNEISSECIYDSNRATKASCKCEKENEKFDGKKCSVDCGNKFCMNRGTCKVDGETCECPEGTTEEDCSGLYGCTYDLIKKCTEISSECIYDLNAETRATCKCKKENEKFDGKKCSECDCGMEGTCSFREDGSKVCDCSPGFLLINGKCENPCASNLCKNEGVCVLNETDFMCECKRPYFGKLCQFHPCHSNPCVNDGACIAVENDYGCVCNEPFHGNFCEIDPCSSGPCMNEGMCSVVGIDFNCTCKTPYRGKQCELDPCSSNPCKNNGMCNVVDDNYYCYCKMPFFGHNCERVHTTDSPISTWPGLTTTLDEINGTVAEINRTGFFTTEQTTISDEVNDTATKINRTEFFTIEQTTISDDCNCGINSINCYVYRGRKLCRCKENYAQRNGTCIKTCKFNRDCVNGGLCKLEGSRYFCKCTDGYLGDRCEVDACRYIRCEPSHVCKRRGETAVCECPEGKYLSRSYRCEDICNYDTCIHGYCKIIAGFSKCVCNNGYFGLHCDEKITQVTEGVQFSLLILILSVGIVIFSVAAIIAICWVKRLNEKVLKN